MNAYTVEDEDTQTTTTIEAENADAAAVGWYRAKMKTLAALVGPEKARQFHGIASLIVTGPDVPEGEWYTVTHKDGKFRIGNRDEWVD